MKLHFDFGGVAHSVESIMEFTKEGQPPFWKDLLFRFYPSLDPADFASLSNREREDLLIEFFTDFHQNNRVLIEEKVALANRHWQSHEGVIVSALEDAFEVDLQNSFNDLICHTSFNPISPRYLEDHTFDHFYLESEKGAMGTAIHEIIHFIWFDVWQKVFRDSPEEYESPHLKWILSEMVVEPIMRDPRLAQRNPYYQHKACVYPYFYSLKSEGQPILDRLYEMFSTRSIEEFMADGLKYCRIHEAAIRQHIEASETSLDER